MSREYPTSIIVPIPAGIKTSKLVFSSIRYRKIIVVDTLRQITEKEESKLMVELRICVIESNFFAPVTNKAVNIYFSHVINKFCV